MPKKNVVESDFKNFKGAAEKIFSIFGGLKNIVVILSSSLWL
jgi:hypothetical protein